MNNLLTITYPQLTIANTNNLQTFVWIWVIILVKYK